MKVKIGDRVYDPNETPIMVILSDEDKKNIAAMPPELCRYCAFPEDSDLAEISKWMGNVVLEGPKGDTTT